MNRFHAWKLCFGSVLTILLLMWQPISLITALHGAAAATLIFAAKDGEWAPIAVLVLVMTFFHMQVAPVIPQPVWQLVAQIWNF